MTNLLAIAAGLVPPPAIPPAAQKAATVVMLMGDEPTYKVQPASRASLATVLSVLEKHPGGLKPFQIADHAGLSASTVSSALKELYDLKRVGRKKVGPTSAYAWRAVHLRSEDAPVQHAVPPVLRPAPAKRRKEPDPAGGNAGGDRPVPKGAKPRADHRSAQKVARVERLEARVKELEVTAGRYIAAVRTGKGQGDAWQALQEVAK